MNNGRGDFFAVDRRTWAKVCGLGMNPACAYVVQACFSARDNRATKASVQAVERYTGIARSRSKQAISALLQSGAVLQVRGGTYPSYELLPAVDVPGVVHILSQPKRAKREPKDLFAQRLAAWTQQTEGARKPDLIWLPNDLVTGASGEAPPLARVRQTQDVMTLRLLIDLYHAQDLLEDGGVSCGVTYQRFERVQVGQRAEFNVWGFRRTGDWVNWTLPVAACHRREQLTAVERKEGENASVDYFRRQGQLRDLGLLEWVPTLFESEACNAESLHPYGIGGTQSLEDQLGQTAHQAGLALLTEGQRTWATGEGLWLVPTHRHLSNVTMIGVARLKYRPRTSKTAAWLADLADKGERIVERYCAIAYGATALAVNM